MGKRAAAILTIQAEARSTTGVFAKKPGLADGSRDLDHDLPFPYRYRGAETKGRRLAPKRRETENLVGK